VLGNNGSAVSDGNAATGLGSGILVQAQIETDDVAVENVEGNGYMLLSGSGDVSINCNTGMHRRVQAFGCKKNGFATKGDDSNQNLFIACSSINSGQAGVYENSALGNHYKALHLSGNGSVIRIGNVAKDNTFTAVYKEIDAVGTLVTFDAGGSGRNHIEFTHAEATVSLAVVDNTASQYNLVSVNGQAGGTTWFGDYGATASFQIDKDKILVRKGKTVQFQDAETPTTNFNLTNGGGNFSILTASSGVGIYFGVAGAFQANVQSDGFHVTGIGAFSGALSAASADVTGVYKVAGTQVVGARSTGWAADTGTAKKTATATYTPGSNLTYSASYVQAEQTATSTRLQLIEPALRDATQEIKALKDALIAHGLIGT
jgi:hypothetical protein